MIGCLGRILHMAYLPENPMLKQATHKTSQWHNQGRSTFLLHLLAVECLHAQMLGC